MPVQILNDSEGMQLALAWAAKAMYITTPNPRVGCVIVRDGIVIGAGHTQPAGQAHAEIEALRDAEARGNDVRGATAYVTLEPCNHQGRTGPCSEALVRAGLGRVVAAITDPNPLVAGQGMARLEAAGIAITSGLMAAEAHEMNIGFFSRMQRGRPWVRLKTAASLDGMTALHNGESQWITGETARNDGHAWRARACAILTGIGTVKADDPQLNVRAVVTPRQPRRVIVDSRLEIDLDARVLQGGASWIATAVSEPDPAAADSTAVPADHENDRAIAQADARATAQAPGRTSEQGIAQTSEPATGHATGKAGEASNEVTERARIAAKCAALRAAGHDIIHLPDAQGKVDLPALMQELGKRGINELHVEAGTKLNGSLMRAGCVDELLLYYAPCLIGDAQGMFALPALDKLDRKIRLRYHNISPIGDDLRVLARIIQPEE